MNETIAAYISVIFQSGYAIFWIKRAREKPKPSSNYSRIKQVKESNQGNLKFNGKREFTTPYFNIPLSPLSLANSKPAEPKQSNGN